MSGSDNLQFELHTKLPFPLRVLHRPILAVCH